jgi:hypothetical protein
MLTVLVGEAVAELSDNELASDDEALRNILERISDRLSDSREVRNPKDSTENLNRLNEDACDAFVEAVEAFRSTAIAACQCSTQIEAAAAWSTAFLHFFPMPDPESVAKVAEATYVPSLIEAPDIEVTAIPRGTLGPEFKGKNGIGPIPKNCTIKFRVLDLWRLGTDVAVEWMVRNEGTEAEDVNDLGHVAGRGLTTEERSAYKGTHYMDCIFKHQGRVVAARRVRVEISGISMPPRNPARRPSYVALRGRR